MSLISKLIIFQAPALQFKEEVANDYSHVKTVKFNDIRAYIGGRDRGDRKSEKISYVYWRHF